MRGGRLGCCFHSSKPQARLETLWGEGGAQAQVGGGGGDAELCTYAQRLAACLGLHIHIPDCIQGEFSAKYDGKQGAESNPDDVTAAIRDIIINDGALI